MLRTSLALVLALVMLAGTRAGYAGEDGKSRDFLKRHRHNHDRHHRERERKEEPREHKREGDRRKGGDDKKDDGDSESGSR